MELQMEFDFAGRSILIIDDEVDFLEILGSVLEHHNASVLTASTGRDGFEMARTHIPDIIVSDISMPGINGFDFLRLIKQFPLTSRIPVVAITSHKDDHYRKRAIASGFNEFVSKPIQYATFFAQLDNLMQS